MTTLASTARDAATMLRRDLRHARRFPLLSISSLTVPVLFLLLFDGVFGRTLRAGLGAATPGAGSYIDYLTPGMLLMTACSTAETTAITVSTDMTERIITRFRTMAISRASVLAGQVLGSFVRTMVSGALVLVVAVALGFRADATPGEWLAAIGVFALLTVAVTSLTVAFGLVAKTPAGANSLSLILVVLPFVSSAYVPTDTMPSGVRWFAENQPFTPIIQTLRGLLAGSPSGRDAILAIVWSIVIAALGATWATAAFARDPAH